MCFNALQVRALMRTLIDNANKCTERIKICLVIIIIIIIIINTNASITGPPHNINCTVSTLSLKLTVPYIVIQY